MTISEALSILDIQKSDLGSELLKRNFKKQMLSWHPDIAINKGISEKNSYKKKSRDYNGIRGAFKKFRISFRKRV
ncbi:MAG: hypothetical protein MK105_02385 [Crocinitomicaceae bacterium]|nr:hypothetical protein [Crocinitomicaceae bacterium]